MNFTKNNNVLNTLPKRIIGVIFSMLLTLTGHAQFSDDFSDGDFTANPSWNGTTADYTINATQQLQLNASVAGTSYLSTPHNLTNFNGKEWSCWVRQNFAGSSSNFGRIYLTSQSADLTTDPDGIYLQLGEALSTDAVRLMQRNGGVTTQICASADGTIAAAFQIGVKVIRDNAGNWSLSIDFAGGVNYSLAATGSEVTIPSGTHFGYLNTYTSGNITRFYLDNIYAGDEVVDTDPPTMISLQIVNDTQLDVTFSEAVTPATAEDVNNYDLVPVNSISTATLDGVNPALVHLQLTSPLINGNTYTLTSSGIEDVNGNASASQSLNVTYLVAEVPVPGDVIINEFMADPSPVIGLPEAEFVEIYNVSNKVLNVSGWKLGDNATFGTIQTGWLLPGEYLVLCPTSSVPEFPGSVGVTSFPSLNNSSDDIVITDNTNVQLDKISYTLDWYQDPAKKDGGWTIERINPLAPCSQASNWQASVAAAGGTPGSQNSVYNTDPDLQAPFIYTTAVNAPNQVQVTFNKPVDSTALSTAVISTTPSLTETGRTILAAYPVSFTIQFAETIPASQLYTISINGVQDCWGNFGNPTGQFLLPAEADSGDIVINEVLFDQYTGGSDWVELYNKSNKIIDLKGWKIARFNNGVISDHKLISSNYLLYPDDYVVIGADSNFVINNYPATTLGKFYQLTLPTLSNDTGSVIVMFEKFVFIDTIDVIMNQLIYSSKWHFKLLDSKDGRSLERMDPNLPTQASNNWHTAAEAIGFATPGGKNSQYYPALYNGEVSLSSETISPDNDGFEDVLQINYQMNTPGMLATIQVYDDRGRIVKTISQNELLGLTGTIVWDGIREDGQKATIGTYVLLMEAFNINGGSEFVSKKAFVVAGKM